MFYRVETGQIEQRGESAHYTEDNDICSSKQECTMHVDMAKQAKMAAAVGNFDLHVVACIFYRF